MSASFPLDAAAVATPEQLFTRLGEEVVILGLQEGAYYGLADVGARIWELLQTPRALSEIVDIIVSEYEVTAERAASDLSTLLGQLESRGLVAITLPDRA